jgi:hypothetical protein
MRHELKRVLIAELLKPIDKAATDGDRITKTSRKSGNTGEKKMRLNEIRMSVGDRAAMKAGRVPPSHLAEIVSHARELKPKNHTAKVRETRVQAIAEELEARKQRAEAAQLQRAKDAGRRMAFDNMLDTARKHKAAAEAEADREADAAEGKPVVLKVKPAAQNTARAKYEAMKAGPERRAYWKRNKREIMKEGK